MGLIFVLVVCVLTPQIWAWEALPTIPSGRRSQFLVLQDDGAYKFGYDTGDGNAAKQEADSSNQVQGHYIYKNVGGQDIDLKYTSGVQGFQPEGLEKIQELLKAAAPQTSSSNYQGYSGSNYYGKSDSYQDDNSGAYVPDDSGAYHLDNSGNYRGDQEPNGDASYNFNIDTPSYKRKESSDAGGNVQGSYSFSNNQGTHDLQYVAGSDTGFIARSGSLSQPNGLRGGSGPSPSGRYHQGLESASGPINSDGSYSFGFSEGDQSRQEDSDSNGNVRGRFSYTNSAGSHDLTYVAGSATGFQPTGGSLAAPNGLGGGFSPSGAVAARNSYSTGGYQDDQSNTGDSSYNFNFDTGDYSRKESADGSGNVKGTYSYRNSAGNHDLSFEAGSGIGFRPTGGSLGLAPGLSESQLRSGFRGATREEFQPYKAATGAAPESKSSYQLGNVKVHTYLPPSNEKRKYGYIFETKY